MPVKDGKKPAAHAHRLLFVEEYLRNGLNGAAAMRTLFPHYTKEISYRKAWIYLKHSWVKAELARRTEEALADAKLTADKTIQGMARDLEFDPAVCFKENGEAKTIHEIPREARKSLRGYKRDKDGMVEFKFPEKTAVREQAMKYFGLYERDNSQKPPAIQVHVPGRRTVVFDPLPLTRKG